VFRLVHRARAAARHFAQEAKRPARRPCANDRRLLRAAPAWCGSAERGAPASVSLSGAGCVDLAREDTLDRADRARELSLPCVEIRREHEALDRARAFEQTECLLVVTACCENVGARDADRLRDLALADRARRGVHGFGLAHGPTNAAQDRDRFCNARPGVLAD